MGLGSSTPAPQNQHLARDRTEGPGLEAEAFHPVSPPGCWPLQLGVLNQPHCPQRLPGHLVAHSCCRILLWHEHMGTLIAVSPRGPGSVSLSLDSSPKHPQPEHPAECHSLKLECALWLAASSPVLHTEAKPSLVTSGLCVHGVLPGPGVLLNNGGWHLQVCT